jgi:hypothetical protein
MKQALVFAGLALGAGITIGTACASAMDGYDPAVPTNIIYVDGADQRGRVGTALERPFLARITNQFGGPVAGVRVDWYILTGRGSLSDSTSISDSEGMLCNTLRLGLYAENIRVQAVVAGVSLSGSPLYFNSTAVLAPDKGEGEPATCAP